ncbi:hypothetical protein PC116_g8939 [Phytophthora cactorum]|uniref:Uncharacterized protein n=1 Tax=Phytophthora cactorum TaxID=29920 RepID=A0A8T1L635_9STRA|nr:hypothetical protein Pcac1_g4514 [Phytophthora cactorum]KAG2858686.1 hypothetical protein PC113_g9596 [Phytophthora cactorum]KAG2995217.1 hypothetical protein PC119_g18118 [Phytophthora cactorum]KAG3055439.1 hypothetical protein PC121_g15782 [Phytophthora cactorum]KAG4243156.1 hypothetical protein PC116_g8939 [Phytophthora cactorum]
MLGLDAVGLPLPPSPRPAAVTATIPRVVSTILTHFHTSKPRTCLSGSVSKNSSLAKKVTDAFLAVCITNRSSVAIARVQTAILEYQPAFLSHDHASLSATTPP